MNYILKKAGHHRYAFIDAGNLFPTHS